MTDAANRGAGAAVLRPVMIMAGGTGGHVFPALAVAKILRDRGIPVVWLGSAGGMETRLVPANGFELERVDVAGLRGKGIASWLRAPFRLIGAVNQARAIVTRLKPRVVLGAGGFASGPGGIAAWLARIPLLVHEQNATAGLTNRCLARVATQVFEAFPGSFGRRIKAVCIGNPVRPEIAAIAPPEKRFAGRTGPIRLLVLGGSQGAQRLNALLPQALARMAPEARPEVRHQAGERGFELTRRAYGELKVDATVVAFIDDMAAAYAWSDLAVCRAGALTISELQAAGLAAVLIPFPAAVDDHQTKNAEVLVRIGAARLVQERDLDADVLSRLITELAADRACLRAMAHAARSSAITDAAARLADSCLAAGAYA
jgi:UDP-N-acetylglucosamine--N-acetylmuramyl-(pentapeptide) pyrophosphoryl-undecaprenol N-acetylglucosamine transferase